MVCHADYISVGDKHPNDLMRLHLAHEGKKNTEFPISQGMSL